MCNDCGCGTTDSLLSILITKRLLDRVASGSVFSAWDITQEIRADVGIGYNVSHSTVRDIVSKWQETNLSGYKRTLSNLKNGKVTYLYHPGRIYISDSEYGDFESKVDEPDYFVAPTPKGFSPDKDTETAYEEYVEDLEVEFEVLTEMVQSFLDGEITLNDLQDSLDDSKEFLALD